MKKLTMQQLAETCTKYGVEFMDERYKGTSFRHNFKCIKHQRVYSTCLDSLLKKKALKCCLSKSQDAANTTLDKIKQISLSHGVEFLDSSYVSINHKHYFKCRTHNKIFKSSFKHIHKGQKLKCCPASDGELKKRNAEDSILSRLNKKGLKLLGEFRGINELHLVKCVNHNFTKIVRLSSALENNKHLACCRRIPALSEQTPHKETLTINKPAIIREANNTCFICKSKQADYECDVHEIDYRKSGNDNLVCMCRMCLTTFRKVYGFKKNTRRQFDEFVEEYKKDPGGRDAILKKINWEK